MYIAVNNDTVVYKSNHRPHVVNGDDFFPPLETIIIEAQANRPNDDVSPWLWWEVPMDRRAELGVVPLENLVAVVDSGVVTNVSIAPDPPTLWVHVTLSGNPALVTSPAGTIYLQNDGVDALTVNAELHDAPVKTPTSQVTQIGGVDIDGLWALELVNVDSRALADTPLVQMTAGAISVSYTTTIAPCELELAEDRLQPIGGYKLKLAQPVRFKIVRALS